MKKKQKRKPRIQIKPMKLDKSITFSYKKYDDLFKFISSQGMIASRVRTGLSQKKQKQLALAIKRARHLALLPFTQTL
ncbi:MAG: 30S ribosomal protein S18 [Candidatus Woesebacteria bacterium]|jgi:small subunit ribosomal protein S18